MQITGSDPVLAVHDLEGSAEWFCTMLGCERTDPDPGNWVFCRAGAVTFMLGRCPNATPAANLGDHSYVAYLTVDSVDGHYRRALEAGADIRRPPTNKPWHRREMALRSPEGHRFMRARPSEAREVPRSVVAMGVSCRGQLFAVRGQLRVLPERIISSASWRRRCRVSSRLASVIQRTNSLRVAIRNAGAGKRDPDDKPSRTHR